MAHEATIRNLDLEQCRLKEKIDRLEEERESLLNQSQAVGEQHKQQVIKLEQVRLITSCFCLRANTGHVTLADFSSPQSLREEHQGYEMELSRLRSHYEEEARRFKEAQVRALEEMEEKHRTMREEALQEKEEEKQLLMMVSHYLSCL